MTVSQSAPDFPIKGTMLRFPRNAVMLLQHTRSILRSGETHFVILEASLLKKATFGYFSCPAAEQENSPGQQPERQRKNHHGTRFMGS
jgi:hypothetical protein